MKTHLKAWKQYFKHWMNKGRDERGDWSVFHLDNVASMLSICISGFLSLKDWRCFSSMAPFCSLLLMCCREPPHIKHLLENDCSKHEIHKWSIHLVSQHQSFGLDLLPKDHIYSVKKACNTVMTRHLNSQNIVQVMMFDHLQHRLYRWSYRPYFTGLSKPKVHLTVIPLQFKLLVKEHFLNFSYKWHL